MKEGVAIEGLNRGLLSRSTSPLVGSMGFKDGSLTGFEDSCCSSVVFYNVGVSTARSKNGPLVSGNPRILK